MNIEKLVKSNAMNTESELMEIVNYYNERLFDGKSKVRNIVWNNRFTRTIGRYTYSNQTIELSRKHHSINNDKELLNTILHEMIHGYLDKGNGHNHKFKSECNRVNRIMGLSIDTRGGEEDAKYIKPKKSKKTYNIKCIGCGEEYTRHKDMTRSHRCRCGGDLVIESIIERLIKSFYNYIYIYI